MSAITAKASRKMKKYAVLTREPRCFLGSFDFSWEQRKLTEFVEFFSGLTYTPNDVQENGTLVLRSSNVSNGEVVDADNIYVNPQVVNSENVKVGDIVVVVRNGSRSLIGKHAQIKAFMPNTVIGAFMTGIRSECPEFTNALLNTSRFEEEIAMNMGATINQITGYMFSKMEFKVPCLDEQKKIGEYFEKLDNLITLHQRKCANLCSPSQVVFSLLFATSTFSWEQRKFEEIAVRSSVICSDDTLPRVEYEDIVSGTGRLNKDIYAKQSIKSGIAFHQGDVLYGKLRPYLQNWLLPTFDGLAVGDFWVLQPQNADSSFLYRLIQSRQFDEVANQSTGTKMPRADWKLVSKTVFSIPSNISEQAAIGTYFTALDSLITLHQRECISFTGRADRLILTANKKRTTSSWEQRKFGEITSKYEDPVPTPHDGYYRLGIRSHAKGTFHSYVAKGQELETAQMHRVAAGNFIVNITFGWEHAVAITDKNDAGKLVSHRFPQFSFAEGMVPEFFRYVIVDEKFRHHLWLASPGGAGRNRVLKLDEMLNYLMRFPSRDEQIKIAEFFRHLDNLITLHQRKPFLMKWRTSDANRNQTNRLVL